MNPSQRHCFRIFGLVIFWLFLALNARPLLANTIGGSDKKPIRILSWWGYLEKGDPTLLSISQKCGAAVSIDEYYSNMEFERRFTAEPTKYDVIIYQETNRGVLGPRIESNANPISIKESYAPIVKNQFERRKYLANTKLFQISLTGILWEEKPGVNVTTNSTIGDIFKQFHKQTVAILDDYSEAAHFFKILMKKGKSSQGTKEIDFPEKSEVKSTLGDNKVIFANDIDELVKDANFGMALTWSGSAMFIRTNNPTKKFRFLVHPDLSYASADLISLIKKRPEARCVAEELSSKKFIDKLSKVTKYFSPYGAVRYDEKSVDRSYAEEIQNGFFSPSSHTAWLDDLSLSNHQKLQKSWLELKTYLAVTRP